MNDQKDLFWRHFCQPAKMVTKHPEKIAKMIAPLTHLKAIRNPASGWKDLNSQTSETARQTRKQPGTRNTGTQEYSPKASMRLVRIKVSPAIHIAPGNHNCRTKNLSVHPDGAWSPIGGPASGHRSTPHRPLSGQERGSNIV